MVFKIIILLGLFLPLSLFAQVDAAPDYSKAVAILTGYSLASAVALGIVTSIVVIINGRRMRGGVLGRALFSLGIGMFIVLVGTVAQFFPKIAPEFMVGTLPNILNTVGYVIMAIAASRILSVTKRQ